MKRISVAIAFLLAWYAGIHAKEQYIFTQISIEEGLTSTINCIFKEKNGEVWLGTPEGLFRFNGNTLHHFDSGLLEGCRVFKTSTDMNGNFWVLTDKFAACRIKGEEEFKIIKPEGSQECMPYQGICHDRGGVWLGSRTSILRYSFKDRKLRVVKKIDKRDGFNISSMILLDQNTIMCGSNMGIILMDIKSLDLYDAPFKVSRQVTSSLVDKKDRVWISTYNNGIEVFDKAGTRLAEFKAETSPLSNNIVLCMTEKDSTIWAGTDGGGINIIDLDNNNISILSHIPGDESSFPAHSIKSIYTDHSGNIWAGSIRDGLIRIRRSGMKTYSDSHIGLTSGLSNPTVLCLFQDKDEEYVWIGTDGEGINRFDPGTNRFTHYESSLKSKVVSIARYSDTELLLSTYSDRLCLFDKNTGRIRKFEFNDPDILYKLKYGGRSINVFNENDRDILLISNSISRYDKRSGICRKIADTPQKNPHKNYFVIGSDGKGVWLHDDINIYYLEENANRLKLRNSIENTIIRCGHIDNSGTMWFATDNGLYRLSEADSTPQLIESALFDNATSVICDLQSRVWIGDERGLYAYLKESGSFAMFGDSDGASRNEYLNKPRLIGRNGDIYIGGVRGLLHIASDFDFNEKEMPELTLAELKVDGMKAVPDTNKCIILPQYSQTLTVRVSAHEKDIFRHKAYRFSIMGTDMVFETKKPVLELTSMPKPGKYNIMASCTCRTGEWSQPDKILTIRVLRPWYASWWFITSIASILFLIAATGYIAMKRKKQASLAMAIKEQEQKMYEDKVGFLINISHELRTPLTLIMAPLKRLLGTITLKSADYQTLSRVYRQSRRMRDLLDMVLDLRKMEEGMSRLKIEKIEMNAWICDTIEDIVNEEKEAGLEICTDLSPEIGIVEFDRKKFETVLSNILINAIKHSSTGGRISVTTRLTEEGMARISISDQGPGLKDIDPSKMFTRFYQSASEQFGSGIGLSYSKILVELHKGRIGAMDNEDKGATFWWEIPLIADIVEIEMDSMGKAYLNELVGQNTEANSPSTEKETFRTVGMTLMLVDDNKDLLDFLKEAMASEFSRIITASSGNSAMKAIMKGDIPDILVSDINMPDGDGYTLCTTIKDSEKYNHIPVILLTAKGEEHSQSDSYRAGADAFIPKPFEIDTLMELLRVTLKRKSEIKKRYLKYDDADTGYGSHEEGFILQMNKIISEHLSNPDLDQQILCREMGMSRAALYNKMKAITGAGAKEYITRIRLEKAKHLLETTSLSIAEISDMTGFSSQGYFSTAFKAYTGMTPREYKKNSEQPK